jgi:hypothetical protein
MNIRICIRSAALAAVAGTLSLACDGTGGTDQGAASTEPVGASVPSTLLASVQASNGETVEFRENGAGNLAIVDTFRYGATAHLMTPDLAKLMPSQVFSKLSNNAALPQALVDAETRFNEVGRNWVATATVAPPAAAAPANAPAFYDFNAWFRQNFCTSPNTVFCEGVARGQIIGPGFVGTVFTVTGGLDITATGPATLEMFQTNGTTNTVIQSATVNPDFAVSLTQWTAPPSRKFGFITGAPGNAEEDLSELNFVPTVVGTQIAGNAMSFSGNYWFAAQDVEVGLGGIPGIGVADFLDITGVTNGSFNDPLVFLQCNTLGNGHTPLQVLAKSTFPTWVAESAVENNYVQQGCF